jgi:hypothetical protein
VSSARAELRAVRHVLWEAHARARALVAELELEEAASPEVKALCDRARRLRTDIERTLLERELEGAA